MLGEGSRVTAAFPNAMQLPYTCFTANALLSWTPQLCCKPPMQVESHPLLQVTLQSGTAWGIQRKDRASAAMLIGSKCKQGTTIN